MILQGQGSFGVGESTARWKQVLLQTSLGLKAANSAAYSLRMWLMTSICGHKCEIISCCFPQMINLFRFAHFPSSVMEFKEFHNFSLIISVMGLFQGYKTP